VSLILMEGFDHYTSDQTDDLENKFTPSGFFVSTGLNAVVGRDGVGQAINMLALANIEKAFTVTSTVVIGFAFKYSRQANTEFLRFRDGATTQVGVFMTNGGALQFQTGGTVEIGRSATLISPDTWNYIEIKIAFHNTAGTLEMRLNGSSVAGIPEITSLDTSLSGDAECDSIIFFGSNDIAPILDDVYILNTSGSRLNDFIGDVRIETIYPTGVGASSDWTPLAGTNWEAVDELVPDDDTTYVESSTSTDKDRHAHGNLVGTPDTVHAVAVNAYAKRTVNGVGDVRAVAHDGTTEGVGAVFTPTLNTYQWAQTIFEDHPSGAAVWTAAEINSGQFGFEVV